MIFENTADDHCFKFSHPFLFEKNAHYHHQTEENNSTCRLEVPFFRISVLFLLIILFRFISTVCNKPSSECCIILQQYTAHIWDAAHVWAKRRSFGSNRHHDDSDSWWKPYLNSSSTTAALCDPQVGGRRTLRQFKFITGKYNS